MLEIVDDYNKNSFAESSEFFKKSKNKESKDVLNDVVITINNIVNYKKKHSITPILIEGTPPCPNAFATTSNMIYVCVDLVQKYNKCALTYIVAHEIAHIVNEDFKNFVNVINMNTSHSIDINSEIDFYLNKKNRYSRTQEILADRDAVIWSMLAGCKENALVSAAQKLFSDKKIENSTHPDKKFRIATIKEKAKQFKYVKKNNLDDFDFFIEIKDFSMARDTIEEYIAFNINDIEGYKKRIYLNFLLYKEGDVSYKNPIIQDCNLLKNSSIKNKICDNI